MEMTTMLAKKVVEQEQPTSLIPERMTVLNEVLMLMVLHREQRWMTAYEIEIEVATLKGDRSRQIQAGPGLKQLMTQELVDDADSKNRVTGRPVTMYRLTKKGDESAKLFVQLFTLWQR